MGVKSEGGAPTEEMDRRMESLEQPGKERNCGGSFIGIIVDA